MKSNWLPQELQSSWKETAHRFLTNNGEEIRITSDGSRSASKNLEYCQIKLKELLKETCSLASPPSQASPEQKKKVSNLIKAAKLQNQTIKIKAKTLKNSRRINQSSRDQL